MGADTRVVWKDFGLAKILTAVQRAGIEKIQVGVVGPKASDLSEDGRLTNAEVAAINYYGSDDGVVPARRFLDEPFKNTRREVTNIFARAVRQILAHPSAPEAALEEVGTKLARMVRDRIIATPGIGRPNAPSTVAKKGFNHPLVMSYALASAISHRLVRMGGEVLEAGAATFGFESFHISGTDSLGGAID